MKNKLIPFLIAATTVETYKAILVHATGKYIGSNPPILTLPPSTGQLSTPIRQEDNQIFIHGFMEPVNASIVNLAYVVLCTVYPALRHDDIRGVQAVYARGGMSVRHDLGGSAPPVWGGYGKLPSILVTLLSRELVNQIIRAKNAFSYISTNDLDSRFLDPKTISQVPPNEKMFINDALSGAE